MPARRSVAIRGGKQEEIGKVKRKRKRRSLSTAQRIEVAFAVGRKQL